MSELMEPRRAARTVPVVSPREYLRKIQPDSNVVRVEVGDLGPSTVKQHELPLIPEIDAAREIVGPVEDVPHHLPLLVIET